jgi:hypothetical protein
VYYLGWTLDTDGSNGRGGEREFLFAFDTSCSKISQLVMSFVLPSYVVALGHIPTHLSSIHHIHFTYSLCSVHLTYLIHPFFFKIALPHSSIFLS